MKKIKMNPRSFFKAFLGIAFFAFYWYWINQKLISEADQTFGLVPFFFLISMATAYFPLPANLLVLGAVKSFDPVIVAAVAGFATLISYFLEYIVFTFLFRFNKVANFKNTWIFQKISPLFEKSKFLILAFASFLPIPSEPLRIYAIVKQYPKIYYMLAGFMGRIPRYFLLGYFGKDYVNSIWFLTAVFVFPGILLLTIRGGVALFNLIKMKFYSKADTSPVQII